VPLQLRELKAKANGDECEETITAAKTVKCIFTTFPEPPSGNTVSTHPFHMFLSFPFFEHSSRKQRLKGWFHTFPYARILLDEMLMWVWFVCAWLETCIVKWVDGK